MEGSGISKLAQVIAIHGYNEYDRFELATITLPPPAIRVKVDNVKIEFDASDIVIAEHLTQHTRTVSINGGADSTLTFKDTLKSGDRVIVASMNGGQTYVVLDRMVTY